MAPRSLPAAPLLLLLLLRLPGGASPLDLSHWDLEGANETCDGKAVCAHEGGNRGSRSRMDLDLNWRDRNCMCDSLCARYGDCCLDSTHFVAAEQRRGAASFSCVDLRQFGGIYMVTACPPEWDDPPVRSRCEADGDARDPLAAMPVTSHTTGLTYRNAHCALCHSDLNHSRSDVWRPRLECPNYVPQRTFPPEAIAEALTFDPDAGSWGLNLTDTGFHKCFVDPVIPETAAQVVRRCEPDITRTCAVNWTNADVRNRCEAYTAHVYQGSDGYRNPHCAICNNVPVQYLACSKTLFRSMFHKDFNPVAFAVLFDLSGGSGAVGMVRPCPDTQQLYDPFFRRCRSVLCTEEGQGFSEGRCITVAVDDDDDDTTPTTKEYLVDHNTTHPIVIDEPVVYHGSNETRITFFTTCPKFILDQEDYEMSEDNLSVVVPTYKRTFPDGEFRVRGDGHLEICASSLGTQLVDKFGPYMGYVTFVGLGVSVVFLLLHLAAFFAIPELQNLSGKNLVSLCLSLLCAYCAFMLGQLLGPPGATCTVTAVVTYYGFLASFSWMLTLAFDVWRTLRLATIKLRVSTGKQWGKFLLYSAWSWLAPAAVVAAALATEYAPPGAVLHDFRPAFGDYSCWFGHRKALLVFFAVPLAVVMALNIAFFSFSAHMIFSTTSTTRFTTTNSGTQRDFRLYIRLALVMGLTWVVGLVAGYLDMEGLWYAFVALNTLQGLFIFLAFTCTEKVVRGAADAMGWKRRRAGLADCKPHRPPSFSWSGVSSTSTHKTHLATSSEASTQRREGETTDKLY